MKMKTNVSEQTKYGKVWPLSVHCISSSSHIATHTKKYYVTKIMYNVLTEILQCLLQSMCRLLNFGAI